MNIRVERNWLIGDTTLGRLFVDGKFCCYTLEDKVRNKKIYGQTAIPYGKYDVDITWSNHFNRKMPLIKNVKGFSGIRIHTGSTNKDTAGCLLVGKEITPDNKLKNSRVAFNELYSKIDNALNKDEKVTIKIVAPDIKPIAFSLSVAILSFGAGYFMYKKAKQNKIIK